MAGAATTPVVATAAAPTPAVRMNLRRCMGELRKVEDGCTAYDTRPEVAKDSTHEQQAERERAHRDPVPREHAETVAADEAHEGLHDDERGQESRQEPDRDQAAAVPVQRLPVLEQIINSGPDHRLNRQEERELGRGRTVNSQNARGHDRGAGTRDPRYHGQAL